MRLDPYADLIVKIPFDMVNDLEKLSREKGFSNSKEFMTTFVRKHMARFYNTDLKDERIKKIGG